ncbi:flagellar biosynthesis protein FlhF [Azohydromonas australica]|uniref:flagellar biosynthesis protein FlhF n=1 Tax=Azohydromonas australica TaxID=364039 RepID=UPI00041E582B|nr:flagellar biosynthesis protein FlhF [Azohydromonas australica]
MNVKRFTARSPREALQLVRQAFGDEAVVLSTRPCPEGVEVLAMPHDGMRQIESMATGLPVRQPPQPVPAPRPRPQPQQARKPQQFQPLQPQPAVGGGMGMSTLSFQEYVRERMLKRRQAEMSRAEAPVLTPMAAAVSAVGKMAATAHPVRPVQSQRVQVQSIQVPPVPVRPIQVSPATMPSMPVLPVAAQPVPAAPLSVAPFQAPPAHELPILSEAIQVSSPEAVAPMALEAVEQAVAPVMADLRREQGEMLNELRSARAMIEQRLDALAYADQLQRNPAQAALSQRLLECGFSPGLIRKLGSGLPPDAGDPLAWAAGVLQRNLCGAEGEVPLEEECGVYALIGSTGVGKTTTTAKLAAACATRHGPGQLGLITLDAYRVGAHEQLRTYGRILGVPVHTAHDRTSLEDLLSLLGGKKMVIIDTAGMAQRDERTRELLDMLVHPSIQRLLVVNAASQGETIDDVMHAWRAAQCRGVILSKLDEAVKLAPALDAVIRHRLRVVGVATGQRVPEDWHRLSGQMLVERALRPAGAAVYRLHADDVSLVLCGTGRAATNPASMLA